MAWKQKGGCRGGRPRKLDATKLKVPGTTEREQIPEERILMLESRLNLLTEEFRQLCTLLASEAENRAQSLSPLKSPTKRKIIEIHNNFIDLCSENDSESSLQNTEAYRKLFFSDEEKNWSMSKNSNFVIVKLPPSKGDNVSSYMPHKVLSSIFPTVELMSLSKQELVVAAYIFEYKKEEELDEILVDTQVVQGTRKLFQCLSPGMCLEDDVLTLVACMLTYEERLPDYYLKNWFLPPYFAQLATTERLFCEKTIYKLKEDFMGFVEYSNKIFIPLNDSNVHWFLMIIDRQANHILYVDSLPTEARKEYRMSIIRQIAKSVENMLLHRCFYECGPCSLPKMSEYEIVIPIGVPKQHNSFDCGLWVANWMALSHLWGHYDVVFLSSHGRMRLALDLIMKEYNRCSKAMITCASQKMEKGHVQQGVSNEQ